MDELEQNFLSELCNMRLQIAYQRFLKERTAEEADKEQERDNHIEELYNSLQRNSIFYTTQIIEITFITFSICNFIRILLKYFLAFFIANF